MGTALPNYLNVARDVGIGLFSYLNILRIAWGINPADIKKKNF